MGEAVRRYFTRLTDISAPEVPWDPTTKIALLSLFLFWAARMYMTWGTWGNLSIDSGHEAYIPDLLARGKMLYRDVWWMYTPLAPYINSLLFRAFGSRLEVLYWAGSLSALGSAVLLFLIGKRLSSRLIGWTAGVVVLLQAFHAWHFCFPLPYSFAPVYGCLTACLFLWSAVNAALSRRWPWIFGAATSAAIALLLKLEFGAACYLTLALLIGARAFQRPSWRNIFADIAAVLPGIAVCSMVLYWMISIRGVEFITQENISSWPTSYFMKAYGKVWLDKTGFSLSTQAFRDAAKRAVFFAGLLVELYLLVHWTRVNAKSLLTRILLAAVLFSFALFQHWRPLSVLAALVFPRDMALYVLIAGLLAIWFFWRLPSDHGLAIILLLNLSGLVALRLLLRMSPGGYPIYYNGPVILAFLMLTRAMLPREGRLSRAVVREELLICLGCLAVVAVYTMQFTADRSDSEWLNTERGSILVPKQVATNYRAGIAFMKEKYSRGEVVMSVPEDTSLYFLSGTDSPTRMFMFCPGIIAPGKPMDDTIREIESHHVRYLLWSNRTYEDYGSPLFGVDYDQVLGQYLTSHFRRVGPLVPNSDLEWETSFVVWERKDASRSELVGSPRF